jgi:uncharacterized membrane protein
LNWYSFLKLLHVIAAIVFVGGVFGRQLVRGSARTTSDVYMLASVMHAAGRIEQIMVIPGSNAAVILGVILAIMQGFPVFGFLQGASKNWLLVSIMLLVIGLVLIPTIFLPRGRRFEPILDAALAEGRITPELRAAMDDKVVQYAHLYEELSTIVIVALMVLKPF